MPKVVAIAMMVLVIIAGTLWIGFLIPVKPFSLQRAPSEPSVPTEPWPIPQGLPTVVERYLRAVSLDGETLPAFRSAQYSGTGWAKPFGVWLPIRHRAEIVPGETMFRVMEFPWYRLTFLHVEDTYLQDEGRTAISGVIEAETTGPRTSQGAFLALAAESIMMPSTESLDATWEGVDDRRARLRFAYRDRREELLVTFDADTGFPVRIEADRYKSEDGEKVRWWIDLMDYRPSRDLMIPSRFEVRWADEPGPWSKWTIDEVILERSEELGPTTYDAIRERSLQ